MRKLLLWRVIYKIAAKQPTVKRKLGYNSTYVLCMSDAAATNARFEEVGDGP